MPQTEQDVIVADGPSSDNVVLLGWTAFFSGMGQEMVYPLVPTFVVLALHSSRAWLGAVEGSLALGVTAARLCSARRLGRGASPRRLTRVAYVMSLAARPLMALAPNVAGVGALRVVDGLGKGGKDGPRDALVAADADRERVGKSFGVQRALDTLGSVAGPAVAGVLLLVVGHGAGGLRLVFACSLFPAVGALWMLRRVHDIPAATRDSTAGSVVFSRPFVVLLVAVTIFGFANSSDTLLLLRGSSVGISPAGLAFAFAGFNLAYAALAIPAGVLSDRFGRRPLLLVGWGAYGLVYLGFAWATGPWQIFALFVGYGVYYASAEGTLKAWVASLVPPERRGAAYGVFAAAAGILVLPASVTAGWVWDRYGPRPAFLIGAVCSTVALVIVAASPSLRAAGRAAIPPGD